MPDVSKPQNQFLAEVKDIYKYWDRAYERNKVRMKETEKMMKEADKQAGKFFSKAAKGIEFAAKGAEMLAKMDKKYTKPAKALMISQAIALTYYNAIRQLGGVFPFNLVAAAVTISAGVSSVNKIREQKFQFGGPVFGPSHSQGGVLAELEGGEHVWSKRDVAAVGGQKAVESLKPSRRSVFSDVSQQERRARRAEYMGWTRRNA